MAESKKRGRPKNSQKGKEPRKANFLKKIFNGDEATKASSFQKRKPTLMKEAKELETLCGIEVCVVCFDCNGSVDYWPNNEAEARKRCCSYMGLSSKEKKELDYKGLMQSKKKKLEKKKKGKMEAEVAKLGEWMEGLSGDPLRHWVTLLEGRVATLRGRIHFLKQHQEEARTDGVGKTAALIEVKQKGYGYHYPEDSCWMTNGNGYGYSLEGIKNIGNDMSYGYLQQGNYEMQLGLGGGTSMIASEYQTTDVYDVVPVSQFHF